MPIDWIENILQAIKDGEIEIAHASVDMPFPNWVSSLHTATEA